MRRIVDDVLRFLGVAQGVYFVVVNIGIGTVVLGAVTGLLALTSELPWWSITIIGSGAFVTTTGLIGLFGSWVAGVRASPLTPPIEAGLKLRGRLAEVEDPSEGARERWSARYQDWMEDAAQTVEAVGVSVRGRILSGSRVQGC